MFHLLRYFSLTSAFVLTVTAVVLVMLYRADQLDEHSNLAREENARLATSFANTFWRNFSPFMSDISNRPVEDRRKRGELRALDIAFRSLTAGLPILKVRIRDMNRRTIYSPVRDEIGELPSHGQHFRDDVPVTESHSTLEFLAEFHTGGGVLTNRWVVQTCSPIHGDDGGVVGWLELHSDVTPSMDRLQSATFRLCSTIGAAFALLYAILFLVVRRAARIIAAQHRELEQGRTDLRAKEQRFRAIADYTYDWESWLDTAGHLQWVNGAVERVAGYSPAQCLAMPDYPLPMIHPDDREAAARIRQMAMAGERADGIEFRLTCRDGSLKWAVASFQPIFSDDGAAMGSRWSIRDITDRKRAEQRTKDSEFRFRSVTQTAADAIISVTADGLVMSWNQGAETMFGYTEAEVQGRDVALVMPQSYRARHMEGLGRVSAGGESRIMGVPMPFEGLRKDGEVFPLELTLSRWEMEGQTCFTAILRDITERKASEAELASRTRELERSNAELEQFAYVTSHDLQEPLRTITSYIQLLQKRYGESLGPDAKEFMSFAVDGAKRMHVLITDLLVYSRVSTHGGPPSLVDLNRPLHSAMTNLGTAIADSGAEVTAETLPAVSADEPQMVSLFQNLIGNAIKYRAPGVSPRITVTVDKAGGEWIISVNDNGIGIAAEHLERIFVIFQRLHLRTEYDGTGIGLAVAKKIVERHGGRIWAQSTPGQGSTFRFTLPDRAVTRA